MVAAAGHGYVFGGLWSLLVAFQAFLSLRLGIGAPRLPLLPFSTPLRELLVVTPLDAVLRTLVWLYVAAVFANGTRNRKLLVFSAIAVLMLVRPRGFDPVETLFVLAGLGILLYVLWRYGFLTTVVMAIVASATQSAAALVRVAESGYLPGAVACILLLATPAVFAMLSRRRFRILPTEPPASTS